ncbi:MAG: hypothetical protein ACFB9M_18460 [Myxococcota bacterium]
MRVIANWASVNVLVVASLVSCVPADFRDFHGSVVESFEPATEPAEDDFFSEPRRALGPPDGRTVALGFGSRLTLRFFRPVPNGDGPDIRIYEVGADGAAARVSVSTEGNRFVPFEDPATGLATDYDLTEVRQDGVIFVRLEGLDDAGQEPGFDLDAVEALH